MTRPGQRRTPAENEPVILAGGQWIIEAPRLPQHLRNYRGALGELALAIPEAARQLDYVDQMSPSFRTLRVSLGEIWDTLCRTIPGARSTPDEPPAHRAYQRPASALIA